MKSGNKVDRDPGDRSSALSLSGRAKFHGDNKFIIGLFGANCSSGRTVTLSDDRWSGSWRDSLALARMADEVGIDFLLPIGRWKGYGGVTDYQGATLETLNWASGLLASTRRITVFGTIHAPLFNPIMAAKMMVTADHIGEGRFGLNIVCGWNEGEFEMFGVDQGQIGQRYEQAQEWIDVVKRLWSPEDDWNYDGRYFHHANVRAKPKPWGGSRPVIMNAGASGVGESFAVRNCDAFFTGASLDTVEGVREKVRSVKAAASELGRDLEVYTVGVVTCRPTKKEAEDYHRSVTVESADWSAIDSIMRLRGLTPEKIGREMFEKRRADFANGSGGTLIVGDPDRVSEQLIRLHESGLRGVAISMVDYAGELPFFAQEVLPRLQRAGIRVPGH